MRVVIDLFFSLATKLFFLPSAAVKDDKSTLNIMTKHYFQGNSRLHTFCGFLSMHCTLGPPPGNSTSLTTANPQLS